MKQHMSLPASLLLLILSLMQAYSFHPGLSLTGKSFSRVMTLHIGTGMTFDDGDQILVSAQKPLGLILEELDGVIVADILDATGQVASAGVQIGDQLVAVQNVDTKAASIEEVMDQIGKAPRVVNLRFQKNR